MANDPEFHEYIDKKLSKYEAIIAKDRMSNDYLGIIGFSRTHNRITWFGVFEKYRGKSIGSKLLNCALNQLDWSKDITVETYPDEYEPGIPTKKIYRKYGLIDIDKTLLDKLDNPIWKMVIPASDRKKGGSFHYKRITTLRYMGTHYHTSMFIYLTVLAIIVEEEHIMIFTLLLISMIVYLKSWSQINAQN